MDNIEAKSPLANAGKAPASQPAPFPAITNVGAEHKGDLPGIIGTEATEIPHSAGPVGPTSEYLLRQILAELAEIKTMLKNTNTPGIPLGSFKS